MSSPMPAAELSLPQGQPDASTRSGLPYDSTTTSYEQSRRQISSVIVSQEILGEMPQLDGGIKYVEIPVVEEVVRHIPKRETVEVEKRVPKIEIEWKERVVEVPQIHYIDRPVEKVEVREVIRNVPIKEVRDVPREVVRTVPKYETRVVEKVVEVPGQIIEVPKPYRVENRVGVKRYNDNAMPVVVAQTIRPSITESSQVIDVDVYEYEPQILTVDVHVAKPVSSHLVAVGTTQEMHQAVTVPAWQYNTILRSINSHLAQEDIQQLPFLVHNNTTPFLAEHETPGYTAPIPTAQIAAAGTFDLNTAQTTHRGMTTMSTLQYNQQQQQQLQIPTTVTGTQLQQPTYGTSQMSPYGGVPAVYPGTTGRTAAESSHAGVSPRPMDIAHRGVQPTTASITNRSRRSAPASQTSMPVSQTMKGAAPKRRTGCEC